MQTTVVRYKIKPDRAEENREYVRKVFEQLDDEKPEGLRYVTFNLEDGLSFVHIAVVETPDGSNPLPETSAFKEFIAELRDRCDEPPAPSKADIIGSYRLFWEREFEA